MYIIPIICMGGPFDGDPLALTLDGDGETLRFTARSMSGRYQAERRPGRGSRWVNDVRGPAAWIPE